MTHPDIEGTRTYRLPVSGDVLQWRPDGLWRLVSGAQFDLEQSRNPRLRAVWSEPPGEDEGITGDGGPAGGSGRPGWWRYSGGVPAEGTVGVRFADGTEAPVVIAGPVWCAEGFDDRSPVSIQVAGDEYDLSLDRRLLAELTEAAQAEAGSPEQPRGVAWLVWNDYGSNRKRLPDVTWPPDAYSCSLQPTEGNDLPFEEGPDLPTLDEALAWARPRTSLILVRPHWDPHRTYRASDGPPTDWQRID